MGWGDLMLGWGGLRAFQMLIRQLTAVIVQEALTWTGFIHCVIELRTMSLAFSYCRIVTCGERDGR